MPFFFFGAAFPSLRLGACLAGLPAAFLAVVFFAALALAAGFVAAFFAGFAGFAFLAREGFFAVLSAVSVSSSSGSGSGTTYHMVGFASFVVTGWLLSGTSMASNVAPSSTSPHPATSYCSGADRCLYGYFTRTTLSTTNTGGAGTGPNFGASVVSLVG